MIVLFGATGDLARRKLLPGMFHLARVGLMPKRFRIIGAARGEIGDEEFRELARESVEGSGRRSPDSEAWERFAESLQLRRASATATRRSRKRSPRPARSSGPTRGTLLYLSLPPRAAAEHDRWAQGGRAGGGAPG